MKDHEPDPKFQLERQLCEQLGRDAKQAVDEWAKPDWPAMLVAHRDGKYPAWVVDEFLKIRDSLEARTAMPAARHRKRPPPLRGLTRFADLFGLADRKVVKAIAGDFDVEIRRLRRERRPWVARWNICLAWGCALWCVFRSPLDKAFRYAGKLLGGPGG